ncbi:MAG: cupin domain-containing protein [Gammaproteobacteria bacterium]|nr:cupin domain-containing protein [Gammaproteobacteria bacterium]
MIHKQFVTWFGCLLALMVIDLQSVSAQVVEPDEHGFMIAAPADLLPAEGSRSTVIYGDPKKPGLYVIQITFAPGRGSRPHFHSTARYITVLKGTWWVSTGPDSDVYDPENMRRVEAGTFIYEPPNGHHYDMAKDEEVTVQIMGMGPVVTTSIPQ